MDLVPKQYAANFASLSPEELTALPHDSAAPKLLASIWALDLVATLFLSLRISCRLIKMRRLWWDDAILIASWVCIMVESSVLTYTTTLGYGKHIWDFEIDKLPALLLPTSIAGTLTVTATAWSKTSFGITLLHITSGWYNKMTWFCIISMNFIMAVAAVMFWISCKPVEKTWNSSIEGTCWEPHVTVIYHLFAGGYSALVDFTFAALPWKFLWSLQMRRKEKLGVMLAMSMGIFAGATAVVKTTKVPRMLSADIADGIPLWIWGNAEVCASIIAASIPMLRVLVRDVRMSGNYQSSSDLYNKKKGGHSGKSVTITGSS
ncbi:hypothetical protein P885DRAFT_69282 [Corynascus similis CBS 632.67]